MPHNELCPACGILVPDWHWEWHAEPGFGEIYRGTAGMECPVCGALISYAGASVPLVTCPATGPVRSVGRDVTQAAVWAQVANNGMSLEAYLATGVGQPYAHYWTQTEVRQADRLAAANP